ncbi:unnamed protein product [Tilletia controversa]|uniref:DinB-like domain-containing protein n=3 Tax=Tilletia TaxID=13289 RepID=A0A8X7SX65_9BASI|nr:hypothetical protein CF336_g5535 [Tilletia laevis]KAE8193359.1 hypothetical protein CF328_g5071 [Tilletia controversa]KAE8257085.1 hypothetical protein A4X03_0g4787 [Tilletia caries]KAE8202312.1 hypothetical protein CF335_g3469 [Tilletia laevis]KAE8247630.1 hypothetical protein A4X06_0g4308 [Tilletia controversa]
MPSDYTLDHTKASSPSSSGQENEGASTSSSALLPSSIDTMPAPEAEQAILESALEVIAQPLPLLRSGTLSDDALAFKSAVIPGSTAGKHLRHVHSHFEILIEAMPDAEHLRREGRQQGAGAEGDDSLPVVDYDRRSRDLKMESSNKVAIAEYEGLMERFRRKMADSGGWLFDRELKVRATTPVVQEFRTTFGREIWFLALHAIHHYALLRICLHEQGIALQSPSSAKDSTTKHGVDPSQFGVAPSTLAQRTWKQELEKSRL